MTNPKNLEIYELSDKEFRKILLKKFSELQKYTDKKLNEIRKTMHEQNEKFNKEIEILKQIEMKNIIAKMKNTLVGINSRLNDTEE